MYLSKKPNKETGLTLIEIIIVITIITLMSTITLASFPKFTEMIYLHKGVQEIASNIRRAQIYGISVKENPGGTGQFPPYGLYFQEVGGRIDSYILFADNFPPAVWPDVSGNSEYDGGIEYIKTYEVPKPGYIFDVDACSGGTCWDINGVVILFKRPVPDIYIRDIGYTNVYDRVELLVGSPRGGTKKVLVWASGQIAVE